MSETVTTALQTAFNSVETDVLGIIEIAVPAALGIMAIILAIRIGIRFFRTVAKG